MLLTVQSKPRVTESVFKISLILKYDRKSLFGMGERIDFMAVYTLFQNIIKYVLFITGRWGQR